MAQLRSLSLAAGINIDISNIGHGHILETLFCKSMNDFIGIIGRAQFFRMDKAIHATVFGFYHISLRIENGLPLDIMNFPSARWKAEK